MRVRPSVFRLRYSDGSGGKKKPSKRNEKLAPKRLSNCSLLQLLRVQFRWHAVDDRRLRGGHRVFRRFLIFPRAPITEEFYCILAHFSSPVFPYHFIRCAVINALKRAALSRRCGQLLFTVDVVRGQVRARRR